MNRRICIIKLINFFSVDVFYVNDLYGNLFLSLPNFWKSSFFSRFFIQALYPLLLETPAPLTTLTNLMVLFLPPWQYNATFWSWIMPIMHFTLQIQLEFAKYPKVIMIMIMIMIMMNDERWIMIMNDDNEKMMNDYWWRMMPEW